MNGLRIYPKRFFWRMFYVSLVVSLILDFLWLHSHVFHYHFSFQYLLGFFAIFGAIGCMALILVSKALGHFIVRDEGYYERKSRR
jgi:hypothetical protein